MTTKKEILMIIDENGKPAKNKTVTVYPAGAGSPSVVATNNGDGTYTIELDPSVNPNIIADRYDIYWDATKKIANTGLFGSWIWKVQKQITTSPQVLNYNTLTDNDGDTLPATIPLAFVQVTSRDDVGVYISNTTTALVSISAITPKGCISGAGAGEWGCITGGGYDVSSGVDLNLTIHGG